MFTFMVNNSGWPADDNIQQLSHIYVLCQHVREDTSVVVATAGDPPMIRYSSYLTFMCCVNMWGKIQVYCGNSGGTANDKIQQHLCVVSTCEGRYKFIVVTAGDPPMIKYSSYLTFMCCVNMWGKIQVYFGNSGWPADDKIQQLSHIYVSCQHVREDTSLLW